MAIMAKTKPRPHTLGIGRMYTVIALESIILLVGIVSLATATPLVTLSPSSSSSSSSLFTTTANNFPQLSATGKNTVYKKSVTARSDLNSMKPSTTSSSPSTSASSKQPPASRTYAPSSWLSVSAMVTTTVVKGNASPSMNAGVSTNTTTTSTTTRSWTSTTDFPSSSSSTTTSQSIPSTASMMTTETATTTSSSTGVSGERFSTVQPQNTNTVVTSTNSPSTSTSTTTNTPSTPLTSTEASTTTSTTTATTTTTTTPLTATTTTVSTASSTETSSTPLTTTEMSSSPSSSSTSASKPPPSTTTPTSATPTTPPTETTPPTPPTTTVTVPTTTTPAPTPGPRFCNITHTNMYYTKCMDCFYTAPCLDGDMAIQDSVEKCTYRRRRYRRSGCQRRCQSVYVVPQCCAGYWGGSCEFDCPGSSITPCNGNGKCSRITGRCVCEIGFTGAACEKCLLQNKYGLNCSEDCRCVSGKCNDGREGDGSCLCQSGFTGRYCDTEIPGCKTLTCHISAQENWRCAEVNGSATCVCNHGYRYDGMKRDCVGINPCTDPKTSCARDSKCVNTSPGQYKCVCVDGFQGDGKVCQPIDLCQTDKGGCEANTYCQYVGPNKRECKCNKGFENYQPSKGCTLTDMCTDKACHVNAKCVTVEPLKAQCSCKDGYSGNGMVCYGNLLERIQELNNGPDHRLRKTFSLSLDLLTRYFAEPLKSGGPFTIFLPNNKAFKNLGRSVYINDSDRAMQIMRQHILIGKHSLEELQNFNRFYTLQGNPALLHIRLNRDIFKFKLHGTSAKAKVLVRNKEAYNGMIHIVNNLLTRQPEVKGDAKISAMDLIKKEVKYNRFETLITSAGFRDTFSKGNITVFAPGNGAWDRLPTGTLDYLMNDKDGKDKLKIILENHIFPGQYPVSTLIKYPRLMSLANIQVSINVTNYGQIRLDGKVNVTQVNIPCSSGYYHHVSDILVPSHINELLPNMCSQMETRQVRGRCGFCSALRQCPLITDTFSSTRTCAFWGKLRGRTRRLQGCAKVCNRRVKVPKCCAGFYGSQCIPCPGGHRNPCNGRGKCADTIKGNGQCRCDADFKGTACELCAQKNRYGPTCNMTCSCLYGTCDEGPKGKGECMWGSCQSGFVGENCDKKLVECGGDTTLCHAHSKCYKMENETITSCRCDPGYRGDGKDCVPINVCEEQENGGCHEQATCQSLGPGVRKCSCNEGWYGDGFACQPVTPCSTGDDCDDNASCINLEPGKYYCVCPKGFKGDGKHCEVSNPCLADNGGCDPYAVCTPLVDGSRNCSCPEGTAGDGFKCYRTILEQVLVHPNLTMVANLLKSLSMEDQILDSLDDNLTFFAPTDAAMKEFVTNVLSEKLTSYFDNDFRIDSFIRFHTLYLDYSTEDFLLMEDIHQKYQTLYDGFSVHIAKVDQNLHIFVNHSDFASFVQSDIRTINGFIHIIDKVLEPFLPDVNTPDLEALLTQNNQLTSFAEAFKDRDLYDYIDELDEYTIFVPTNTALESMPERLTTDFLKYYIVPESYIFTPSVTDDMIATTAVGPTHQLQFTVLKDRIYVNGVPIIKSDILIDGGVVHIIDGLLRHTLHRCDRVSYQVNTSNCGPCDQTEVLKCPRGFQAFSPIKLVRYKCYFNTADLPFSVDLANSGRDSVGCQQLCYRNSSIKECCSGYHGPSCIECPGGAEEPCGPHGTCIDGLMGDGSCSCDDGFTGVLCRKCQRADVTGPDCDIAYSSCDFNNGNCSQFATCQMSASGSSCHCRKGYVGDGYTCTSVCDTNYYGGCHNKAKCVVKNGMMQAGENSEDSFKCVCDKGYHGNGTWCSPVVNLCETNNGGCDVDRAVCFFQAPEAWDPSPGHVTCDCHAGFVGNGKICNKHMVDALSRMKELAYFFKYIEDTDSNRSTPLIPIMTDLDQKLTLFAPISKDWTTLDVPSLLLVDQLTILDVDQIKDGVWNFTSLSGSPVAVTVSGDNQLLANDVGITKEMVETINGIIYLTEKPIIPYENVKVEASTNPTESRSLTIVIVCTVLAVVVIVSVVCAVLLVRSARATGSFNIFKSFRSSSESTLSFARLNAQDEDSDSFHSTDTTKYDNPLFEDPAID